MTDTALPPSTMSTTQAAWAAAVAVVTALWVAAALADGDPAPVDTTAMGAAAAAGAAAALGAGWAFRAIRPLWLAGLALVVLPVGVAAATRGSAPVLALALLALAAGEVVSALVGADEQSSKGEALLGAGLVLVAASMVIATIVAGHDANGRWVLRGDEEAASVFGLVAATLLLVAATFGPARGRALAVPGLLIGVLVAPGLPGVTVAVLGGALAALSAVAVGRRPGLAVGFLALAVASFPAGRPAAALLAAGAALAFAYAAGHPATALLAVPGVAAVSTALVSTGAETVVVVLAVAIAATATLLALAAARDTPAVEVGEGPLAAVPAALLGAWLFLVPSTWAWTGAEGLYDYDRGAAAAVAGGLIAVVTRWALASREPA